MFAIWQSLQSDFAYLYKLDKQLWIYSQKVYTLWVKKNCATFIFTVTLANVGRFLADRTNGRAIATLLRLSVCLWRYVLWLNGAS